MSETAHTSPPGQITKWSGQEAWITGPAIDSGPQKGKPSLIALSVLKRDAPLISAAPELLEALEASTAWIVELAASGDAGFWDGEDMDEVIAARAAIAKARGQS